MMKPETKLKIGGLIWFAAGCLLMNKGVHFLMVDSDGPILSWVSSLVGNQEYGAILLMVLALFLGYGKGKTVMRKLVDREAKRLYSYSGSPTNLNLYSRRQVMILGLMAFIALGLRFIGLPSDIRGVIDVAIGAALIHGSMHYLKVSRNRVPA